MKARNLIKNQIIKCWRKSVSEDYESQRVNSERSLQASLWSNLNAILPKTRRIFIEPAMSIKTKNGLKVVYPDIVICNTKEVISIIEIKYLPRTKANYKKDINSLSLIAESRKKISISNKRYRGNEADSTKYSLSKNILFVWAGIHKKGKVESSELYSNGVKSLEGCYIELHALTEEKSKPSVIIKK